MHNEQVIKSFDGTKLYMKRDIPDGCRGIVVIVHGLCEHQGRYDYLTEKFNRHELGCYRFDHRGHGRSEGERTYFEKWTELTDDTNVIVDIAMAENSGMPVFLLGHSLGGFCVALYGIRYPGKVSGIVMSGALTHDNRRSTENLPSDLDPHTQLLNELGSGICSVQEVVDDYEADPYNVKTITAGLFYMINDGIAYLNEHYKEFTYPVLMLHGEKDALVDVSDTFAGFSEVASADRQMKIYGGLYHEIFNEYCRDETICDTVNWIINRL